MKIALLIISALCLASIAHANSRAVTRLVGSCRAHVVTELNRTNNDRTGCVKSAFVGSVRRINKTEFILAYGRNVCEGYLSGLANLDLTITEQNRVGDITSISKCQVERLNITNEEGD